MMANAIEPGSEWVLSGFESGVLYSASLVVALYDRPNIAADIIKLAGLGYADCSSLGECERRNLRKLAGESGIALRGLL